MKISGVQCSECELYLRITGPDDQSGTAILNKIFCGDYNCPECDGPVRPRFDIDVRKDKFRIIDVSLSELWLALNGRGLPGETATIPKIRELFKEPIKDIVLTTSTGGHVRIHSITFEGGEQMHFAVSSGYAAVYKITKEE